MLPVGMETSSAPDFAPAWLKLPAEKQKPLSSVGESRSRSQQRDANSSYYHGNARHRHSSNSSSSSSGDIHPPPPRRDSWDSRQLRSSADVDDGGHWQHYNSGSRFGSQPTLNRRGGSSRPSDLNTYKDYSLYDFSNGRSGNISSKARSSNGVLDKSKSAQDAKFDKDFPTLRGDVVAPLPPQTSAWSSAVNGNSRSLLGTANRFTSLTSTGSGMSAAVSSRITRTNLNPRLVTNPRNLSDRKSDFLRALRSSHNGVSSAQPRLAPVVQAEPTSSPSQHIETEEATEAEKLDEELRDQSQKEPIKVHQSNGIDILGGAENKETSDQTTGLLSSSLEAERRLLREMGWTEDDDDTSYAPLTEAEMREFADLTKKMGQRKNGFAKGIQISFNSRSAPNTAAAAAAPSDDDGDTSSLDSDSD